jgi:Ca-activated chloride channel family protein
LQVPFAYSPNQEPLLLPLIDRFNSERHELHGARVEIVREALQSGDAEAKIAHRIERPVLWSPASSLWGQLLDYGTHASWAPRTSPSLVRTPLVLALWRAEAKVLGWPRKPIGFAQIIALASNRRGWSDYGLPTYGPFKLGHTNPDFSSSGLSFVVAQYYTATGPGYVSAVAMEEVSLLEYNRTRASGAQPLVAIYPSEGTF